MNSDELYLGRNERTFRADVEGFEAGRELNNAVKEDIKKAIDFYCAYYNPSDRGDHRITFLTGWLLGRNFDPPDYEEMTLFDELFYEKTGLPH